MNETTTIQSLAAWSLALLPALYAAVALALPKLQQPHRMWRAAIGLAGATTVLAGLATIGLLASAAAMVPLFQGATGSAAVFGIRLDSLTVIMALLVSFISWIILRYAQRYLAGEPGQDRFLRWFSATVASVSLLVVTDHLLVLAVGWICASLSLHQLLTFYSDRTQATLAAHKKFILSRVADACLVVAFVLIGRAYGSYHLDAIFASVDASSAGLPAGVVVATVLIATAMILKCAQLPFHGWLIQVMEAPTPVSALLHAGVVNIGGFLLIRLAPLMAQSPAAQWLLVVVGSLTAVIAGLVMMTRISVKVNLAWSTCAQMGFMLLECGMGAYGLALLHLVAHSLYKAYCFLSSGTAAADCMQRKLSASRPQHSLGGWAAALALGAGSVAVAAFLIGPDPVQEPAVWAFAGIVSVGVTTMIGEALAQRNGRATALMLACGFAVGLAYFALHAAVVHHAGLPLPVVDPYPGMVAVVLALFGLQLLTYVASRVAPQHPAMTRLHAYLYHGVYLDEIFTRVTFLIWPPRLTRRSPADDTPQTLTIATEKGVRT